MTVSVVEKVALSDLVESGLQKEFALGLYRKMVLIRRFEETAERLALKDKVLRGPLHLSIGQEAIAAGVMTALGKEDVIVSTYRGHGHALARGVPAKYMFAELFGKETGTCRGVGGSMHSPKYPELGMMFATSIVGSGIPIGAGMGLAIKMRGEKRVVAVFFGDGAVNNGAFHEGVNMAAIWRLPVVFVCENNQYAISMKSSVAVAGRGIAFRAEAYGIPGIVVDGNDVFSVYKATIEARKRALRGEGPTLMECVTYRMRGHGVYDQDSYRPREEVEAWRAKDPIARLKTTILSLGVATEEELRGIEGEVEEEIQEALEFARSSPMLPFEKLADLVYYG